MGLKHFFHSVKADPADPTIIGATKWNDDHYYVDGAGAPVGNVGALLLAGVAGALTHLNSVAAGSVLTSAGVGALPVWAAPGPVSSLTLDAAGVLAWATRSRITSPIDGHLTVTNAAGNDFLSLKLGPATAAFPQLTRDGDSLVIKTGDGAAYAGMTAREFVSATGQFFFNGIKTLGMFIGSGSPEGSIAANIGSLYLRWDGGAGTVFYVKESGAATSASGWVAK
jgi:hypothetical protein